MIVKAYLIIAVIVIACFFYLSQLNQETMTIKLTNSFSPEISVVYLLIITFLVGFVLSFIVSIFKGGSGFIHNLRTKQSRKNIRSSSVHLDEAKKAILLDNWEKGEELLNKCISTSSQNLEPHTLLLARYLDKGDFDKAFQIVDNLPAGLESELEMLLLKVKALMAKQSYERAIDILKIINEQESCTETKILLRNAYIEFQKWEKAADLQKEIVTSTKKGTDKKELNLAIKIDYEIAKEFEKNGKKDDAVKKLTELLKREKKFAPPYIALGNIYLEMGKGKETVTTWKTGFDKTSNLVFIFLLEDYYLEEEDPQSIITIYRNLVNDNSNNPGFHLLAGKLYLRLEMTDEAASSFKRAEELGLESENLTKLTGEICFRKEYYKDAAKKFKKALKLKRAVRISFRCSSCSTVSDEWEETCPKCGIWDASIIDIDTVHSGLS